MVSGSATTYRDLVSESDVAVGDRTLRVRDAGQPDGSPVVYFHGTPGSRLDVVSLELQASRLGVRLVSFDRPGYGGSTSAPFGLSSVAADCEAVADALALDRFATLGQSGGGPFALASAAHLGDRVTRVGVASGAGPFHDIPGATDVLDDDDRAALALLPDDPDSAMRIFAAGFAPWAEAIRAGDPDQVVAGFVATVNPHDAELLRDRDLALSVAATFKEAVRRGVDGGGWDNVAWLGPWELDLRDVRRPVLLWYGDDDAMAPPDHGRWLRDHLPDATLTLRPGEGHLGLFEHADEVLTALVA